MTQKNRSGRQSAGAILEIRLVSLANFRAKEFSVALELHLSAAEEISNSCDRLLGVGGAGADSENQIAE